MTTVDPNDGTTIGFDRLPAAHPGRQSHHVAPEALAPVLTEFFNA
ncbi:MAG: hypothetical protein ACXWXN_03430 [Actinomycetota bacterium]